MKDLIMPKKSTYVVYWRSEGDKIVKHVCHSRSALKEFLETLKKRKRRYEVYLMKKLRM